MKRGAPMKRSRLRRANPANRKRLHQQQYDGGCDHDGFIRSLPCVVASEWERLPECEGVIEAAHVRRRSDGGKARDLVPLCSHHHRVQGVIHVPAFNARYGVDLEAIAARLWREHTEGVSL